MFSTLKARRDRWWHVLLRYGLAVVMFGAVLGLSLLLEKVDFKLNLTIPIVFALVATVWWGGRGPGILISLLFEGTTILYAKPTPEIGPGRVWFGYLSVFALYIFLVLLIGYLKEARDDLKQQRDLLHVTLSSIGDGVIATDPNGNVTFMNPVAQHMTGWRIEEAETLPLTDVFSIINEFTDKPVENPVKKVLATGNVVGLANHTILLSKNGARRPIDDCAAPILHDGLVHGVVLVFSDVTERKKAERSQRESEIMSRLVDAQESERRRIARDLHDHLGQRMTALRLKLGSLKEEFPPVPGVVSTLHDLETAAATLDRDIGFLSWELRPTELEELGLVNALATFVREWAGQYGIRTEFQSMPHLDGERLPLTIETNLYRITQEALNNVLKHADARNVNVLLQGGNDDLRLIIEDDGHGFIQTVENGKPNGSRLGMIGMRERAALLGGTMTIDSSPEGSTVIVSIPLTKDTVEKAPVV